MAKERTTPCIKFHQATLSPVQLWGTLLHPLALTQHAVPKVAQAVKSLQKNRNGRYFMNTSRNANFAPELYFRGMREACLGICHPYATTKTQIICPHPIMPHPEYGWKKESLPSSACSHLLLLLFLCNPSLNAALMMSRLLMRRSPSC